MFTLCADYEITGEQKRVVDTIVDKYKNNAQRQVLLGVTGSGEDFYHGKHHQPIESADPGAFSQ